MDAEPTLAFIADNRDKALYLAEMIILHAGVFEGYDYTKKEPLAVVIQKHLDDFEKWGI